MIIISALDNSGQLYGADLITHLKQHLPNEKFTGIGGKELKQAGCHLIHDISDSSAMLTGVIGALKWAVPAFGKLKKLIKSEQVKLVILIDSPTFNLPLAKLAKKHNIKTLYYIAPQTWAWAEFRTKKIKKRVDKLAVILPFEQQYFKSHSIDAEFVGHPFIARIKDKPIDTNLLRQLRNLHKNSKNLLIMPGSRNHVIRELLPAQLDIAKHIKSQIPNLNIFIAAWPSAIEMIKQLTLSANFSYEQNNLTQSSDTIKIFTENHNTIMQACDLALAASGTGTLELAYHACPMIIMYNASKFLYHLIAKHLIKTQFLSLINILANRQLVPEFMPYIKDKQLVVTKAIDMLKNQETTEKLKIELKNLIATLDTTSNPAKNAANLAINLIAEK